MNSKPKSGVRGLSERAQGILHRLLDEQVEPEAIARVLWLQSRERISPPAITRYASGYRKRRQEQQRLRDKLDDLLAQARTQGITTSDLLRAAWLEKLSRSQRDGTLRKMDLLALENVDRKRGEYELKQKQAAWSAEYKQRELALKERQVRVAERRFRLLRDKARAHVQTLEQKVAGGQSLTQQDVARIREIYGLYEDQTLPHEQAQTSNAN